MKVASLKSGGRDGTLVVVSEDLAKAVAVPEIARTLQGALDRWSDCEPALERTYESLNAGRCPDAFPFIEEDAHSPLPRAFQWCEGSIWIAHLERTREATNRELPAAFHSEVAMYQGGSDGFVPPRSPMVCADDGWDADLEAGICVVTDDVPMGVGVAKAAAHIKLVMLVNDFSLRRLQFPEMAKGLGVLQSKPANAYSPVAVSPRTLGAHWQNCMLALPVRVVARGEVIGQPVGHADALFTFPDLIAHVARTRSLCAGSIIGGGTVANRDPARGCACLLEKRAIEVLEMGQSRTNFLKYGDRIRIECLDERGRSIFGAIDQALMPPATCPTCRP